MNQNINLNEWHIRKDLAACYQLVDYFGWTDLIYTHISARIPGSQDYFLINELGLHFHEITPENLIKVDKNGAIVDKTDSEINLAGYVIHSGIYQSRSDINCIIHTHSDVGMALSSLNCGLLPLTQHACRFYNRVAYHDYEGISFDSAEQPQLIKDLGSKNVMILKNHGFLTMGKTIAEAFINLYFLEKAGKSQLMAQATGENLVIPSHETCEKTAIQFETSNHPTEDQVWAAMLRLIHKPKGKENAYSSTFTRTWN